MYKKTIFTLLLFLTPIGFIEQSKHKSSSQIISDEYVSIGNINHHLIDRLFEANEENSIAKKNYWGKGDLVSQQRCCSYSEKTFHNF